MLRYNNLAGFLREKYNGAVRKICIDGGFTCPNRDGTCGIGGCIFCGERGAGEHILADGQSIADQVRSYFSRNPRGDGFIAYFQNFTNTYAPIDVLRQRYDAALIDERIVALAIGTRPDCITEEVADLLREYAVDRDVWVELGLQTINDRTATIINRGYLSDVFDRAVSILGDKNIPVVVHVIVGLPGETKNDVMRTIDHIGQLGLWGIKIHSIYVMKGTVLEGMFRCGSYCPPSMEEYVDIVASAIARLPPDMIVHRLTGDCPHDLLVAPDWNRDKNAVIGAINAKLQEKDWRQGSLFGLR